MAAISDDTAALVAAQLALAYVTRVGPRKLDERYGQTECEADILRIYMRYKGAVREATIQQTSPA